MCVIVDVTHELVRFSPPGGTKKPPEGEGKKSKKNMRTRWGDEAGEAGKSKKQREKKYFRTSGREIRREKGRRKRNERAEKKEKRDALSLSCSSLHAPHGSVFLCPSSAHVPCALAAMQRELLGFFRHEGKPREEREGDRSRASTIIARSIPPLSRSPLLIFSFPSHRAGEKLRLRRRKREGAGHTTKGPWTNNARHRAIRSGGLVAKKKIWEREKKKSVMRAGGRAEARCERSVCVCAPGGNDSGCIAQTTDAVPRVMLAARVGGCDLFSC